MVEFHLGLMNWSTMISIPAAPQVNEQSLSKQRMPFLAFHHHSIAHSSVSIIALQKEKVFVKDASKYTTLHRARHKTVVEIEHELYKYLLIPRLV